MTEDFDHLHFNTAISQLMVFINECYKVEVVPKEYAEGFVKMLYPITPHFGEELWSILGHNETITYEPWPTYDEAKLVDDEVEVVVQVNGKVRSKVTVPKDAAKEQLEQVAKEDERVKEHIDGKEIVKVIVIPGKLVNIVVK